MAGGAAPYNIGSAVLPVGTATAGDTLRAAENAGLLAASNEDIAKLRIVQLERELAALRNETEQAAIKAEQQGYDRGRAVASRLEEERLTALGKALNEALERALGIVENETTLAVDIAREALSRILGDPVQYQSGIVATAGHWAKQLSSSSIVRLRVSAEDFPATDAHDPLALFGAGFEVVRDPALVSGTCLFDLVLGRLDASLPRQMAEVDALLDRVATNAAVAA